MELIEGKYYWVKAFNESDKWEVARRRDGIWKFTDGGTMTSVFKIDTSGPIEPPEN